MKTLVIALLAVFSITACAESAPALSAEQVLYTNFLNTYKPLEKCLNEKLGGIATNKAASAIVAADKLSLLNQEAVSLLPPDDPGLLIAIKESDAEKKALAFLDALVNYRINRIDQKNEFDSYGLLREVVPAIVLSEINSVGCKQPEYLEYWARESDRVDIYLNMAMEAEELSDCAYAPTGKPSSEWPKIIVEANKLKDLEMLAVRVLGKDNPQLISAMSETDALVKANSLILVIGQFAAEDTSPNQSNEISIRHILGLSGIKMIYSEAKGLACQLPEPSWHTIAWKYIEDHPFDANPSPFTANNKVETP